jgi:methyltransferase
MPDLESTHHWGLTPFIVASVALLVVLLIMVAELLLSRRNEDRLRAMGAWEPPEDVYKTMRWAYPAAFVLMAVEGGVVGPEPGVATIAGAVVLAASKSLKAWAIASLGPRWTFRVLVVPGAPLVRSGPYAFVNHPNYIAVVGELAGMALLVGTRIAGPIATVLFTLLIRRRIAVENRALGTSLAADH